MRTATSRASPRAVASRVVRSARSTRVAFVEPRRSLLHLRRGVGQFGARACAGPPRRLAARCSFACDARAFGLELDFGLPQLGLDAFRVPVRGACVSASALLLARAAGAAFVAQLLARRARRSVSADRRPSVARRIASSRPAISRSRASASCCDCHGHAGLERVERDDETEPEVGARGGAHAHNVDASNARSSRAAVSATSSPRVVVRPLGQRPAARPGGRRSVRATRSRKSASCSNARRSWRGPGPCIKPRRSNPRRWRRASGTSSPSRLRSVSAAASSSGVDRWSGTDARALPVGSVIPSSEMLRRQLRTVH